MKIALIMSTLFFIGCTTTQPHMAEYVLAPKIEKRNYESKKCHDRSIKIGQVFSAKALRTKKMKYIQDELQEDTFTQSQWSRTPSHAISDALLISIRSSGLFEDVSSFRSKAKTDLLLETHVEKFIQYFEDTNEKSYVEVVMTLNLLETKSAKSIGHTTVSTKVQSSSVDAKGGVVALNKALQKSLLEVNSWLNGACQ